MHYVAVKINVGNLVTQHNTLKREIHQAIYDAAHDILKSSHQIARDTQTIRSRTGRMRAGWKYGAQKVAMGAVGYLQNEVPYAFYQEVGTGVFGPKRAPYWIYPNKARCLRFVAASGQVVFAARVRHFGVHPRYIGRAAMYGRDAMFFGVDHTRNVKLINRWLTDAAKSR